MSDKVIVQRNRIGLGTGLFLVFLVLKLIGYITWSWWWVTAPLWISFLLIMSILFVVGIIAVIAITIESKSD